MPRSIPQLDVSAARNSGAAARASLGREMREILETAGIFQAVGHGVPAMAIDDVLAAARDFHDQADDEKRKLVPHTFHRGYNPYPPPPDPAAERHHDQVESFMIMHELPEDDPDVRAGHPLHAANRWPANLPGFRGRVLAYDTAVRGFGATLLGPLALAYGMPADHFTASFARPVTYLRLSHYRALSPPLPAGLYGSSPQTDSGFLTVVAQDAAGGLQAQDEDGTWSDVAPVPGALIVNLGDLAHRWTNGRLRAAPHRVMPAPGKERYSAIYFMDPAVEATVACLPSCVPAGAGPSFPPLTYGAYLKERFAGLVGG
jgi:isopenicillin N synthase-like dioxygenase